MGLKRGLIAMAAIALTFTTLSYAEETHKGVAMHSAAMTKGHSGAAQSHALAGHPVSPEQEANNFLNGLQSHSRAGHPVIAAHQQGHHQRSHHHWKNTMSKEQNEKMEAMHLAVRRDLGPLKAELKFREAQLKNLVTTEEVNMAAIRGKIKAISSIQAKILTKRYSHIVAMRKILTPVQRQSFDLEFLSGADHWKGHHKGH